MADRKDEVIELNLDDIIPNRFQPREVFDERALKELALSIREHGVIQPIIVRKVNEKYEIIAGERRYKASAIAGLSKIPAIVRDLDDKESSKVALLENLQRKDLNPIEEAKTYQKILELDEMTQEELAKTMGKSQSAVSNKLRLLALSDEVKDALLNEKISERHARTLAGVKDIDKQKELLKRIIDEKMTVRQLEEEIVKINGTNKEEEPEEKEERQEQTVDMSSFLNNSPLMPTGEMPEIEDHFGEVKIVPPSEEGKEESPIPLINESETEDEKKEEQEENESTTEANDLDNLLSSVGKEETENKFIAPNLLATSEEESTSSNDSILNNPVKDIINDTEEEKATTDYFDKGEEKDIDLPISGDADNVEGVSLSSVIEQDEAQNTPPEEEQVTYTTVDATNKIRELVEELKKHGIKANIDEMDFKKSYQIIIKIDKEEE